MLIQAGFDPGKTMSEHTLKAGLLKMNSSLHFDPGGGLGMWHPFIETRQGVWYNGNHVCSMGRGAALPEQNVWEIVRDRKTGKEVTRYVKYVGWMHTLQAMVDRQIPGVTWDNIYRVFMVRKEERHGQRETLSVAV